MPSIDRSRLSSPLSLEGAPRVAIVGPAGVGKTTEVRRLLAEGGQACVWVVCGPGRSVRMAMADALGVVRGEGLASEEYARLARLATGRIVVLDGIAPDGAGSTGWEDVGPLVDALADVGVGVVCTARVRPMLPGLDVVALRGLDREASRSLFARSVSEAGGDLTGVDDAQIDRLLDRLDGLPLAIGLAAAQVRVFGVQGLIDAGPQVLVDGADSMVDLVQAGIGALPAPARSALDRLVGIEGAFDLAVVRAVGGDGAFAALPQLVDRHLVQIATETPRTWSVYQTVRAAHVSQVPAAIREEVDRHLSTHVLRLAAGVDHRFAAWASPIDAGFDALVAREGDLLRLMPRPEAALALDALLKLRGPTVERIRVLRRAVDAAADEPLASVVRLAAVEAGAISRSQAALDALVDAPDVAVRAWALRIRARDRASRGAFDAALADARSALDLDPGSARGLAVLGQVHAARGERAESMAAYHRALSAAVVEGSARDEAAVLGFLAMSEHDLGQAGEARAYGRRALAAMEAVGDARRAAMTMQLLGEIALDAGELEEADRAWGEGLERLEAVGEVRWRSYCLAGRGMVRALSGDLEAARPWLQQALDAARVHDSARQHGVVAGWAAVVAAVDGDAESVHAWLDEIRPEARAAPKVAGITAVARACLAGASDVPEEGPAEVRIVARWVQSRAPHGAGLVLGPELAWMAIGGTRTPLARRHANRRVLAHLVELHRDGRDAYAGVDDLLAAGWPDETVLPEAGAARVYTALATLRRWGLRRWLERTDYGYRLSPDLAITRA
jgi:tetratricopeptide (TPR) repeat protein